MSGTNTGKLKDIKNQLADTQPIGAGKIREPHVFRFSLGFSAKDVFKTFFRLKSKDRLIIYATHNRFFANMADCKLEMIDGNIKTVNARIK